MTNLCTKFHLKIFMHIRGNERKLNPEWRKGVTLYAPAISWQGQKSFRCPTPRGIALPKLIPPELNSNLTCIFLRHIYILNGDWYWYFSKSKGYNSSENYLTWTKFELDLHIVMTHLYTKISTESVKVWKGSWMETGNNWNISKNKGHKSEIIHKSWG